MSAQHTPTPAEQKHYLESRIAWAEESVDPTNATALPTLRALLSTLNEREGLLTELRELRERIAELEPAAERWDAIAKCYRITCMGSAGLVEPMESGYAHATFNLWTVGGKPPEGATGDRQDLHGRERLARFVEIALANAALRARGSV